MTRAFLVFTLGAAFLLQTGSPAALRVDSGRANDSGRALEIIRSGDEKAALEAVRGLLDASQGSANRAAGESVARALNLFAERFTVNFPTDNLSFTVHAFLWRNMRRPRADSLEQAKQESEGFKEFLVGLYQTAQPPWLKATALFNLAENRLLTDRELGGLTESQRQEAVQAAKTLRDQLGHLPTPSHRTGYQPQGEYFRDFMDDIVLELSSLYVGSIAPDIEGVDLNGKTFRLSDYRGKIVFLSFWARWCTPCLAMFPHENELVERLKDRPFALIGVNGDESVDIARQTVAEFKLTWRSFAPGPGGWEGGIPKAWNVRGWPLMYVLGADGRILWKDRSDEGVDAVIEAALAQLEKSR